MVGWHHRFNGHELGKTPGDGEGQRGLESCGPWGHRVRHDLATQQQQQQQQAKGPSQLAAPACNSQAQSTACTPEPAWGWGVSLTPEDGPFCLSPTLLQPLLLI